MPFPAMAFVGVVAVSSFVLFLSSRILNLEDKAFLTAVKVSLVQWGLMLLLSATALPVNYVGLFLFLLFIKYFYRIDIKKSLILWVINLVVLAFLKVAAGLSFPPALRMVG